MKNKVSLIVVFFCLFTTYNNYSQNNSIAKAYYIKSKEAFAENNYKSVLEYLEKAQEELGETNPDIIYLEILSRFKINNTDPEISRLSLDFINAANPNDERIEKISLIAIEHNELIDAEVKKEEKMYRRAIQTKSLADLRKYIAAYPTGNRTENIESLLSQKERNKYENAKQKNTVKSLKDYINDFPSGSYIQQAEGLLQKAREEELYKKTITENDISLYKSYLIQYPEGKYAGVVAKNLEREMLEKANVEFGNENYSSAKRAYADYNRQFPTGQNSDLVNTRLNEIEEKLIKQRRKQNRTSANYFMLTYSTDQSYGIEFGKLHLTRLGTYLDLNGNESVLNLKFASDEEIQSFHPSLEEAFLSVSFGLTFKVAYPLWVYAGGGVRYSEYFVEDDVDIITYEIQEEESHQFFPEVGLKLKLGKALVLKTGAFFLDGEPTFHAGIGFQTRNW